MDWKKSRLGRNRNVFKGSVLVSTFLERHPQRFKNRATSASYARRLFRDGIIKSIFNAGTFEDSAQLYVWQEDAITAAWQFLARAGPQEFRNRFHNLDLKLIEDVRTKISNRADNLSLINNFFKELEKDFPNLEFQQSSRTHNRHSSPSSAYRAPSNRDGCHGYSNINSLVLTDSSGASRPQRNYRTPKNYHNPRLSASRRLNYGAIMEEGVHDMESTDVGSVDYDGYPISGQNSHISSAGESVDHIPRRWPDGGASYSDNEKQLIEEMNMMKKNHQSVLMTYEERINKLMAKMHELRSIAEMLENSSTKSSPYGILPTRAGLLSLIGSKLDIDPPSSSPQMPKDEYDGPPLPPRPEKESKDFTSKPLLTPKHRMQPLPWKRILLEDEDSVRQSATVWHSVMNTKIDGEDIEKLFGETSGSSTIKDITLYEDLYTRRGKHRNQLTSVVDIEKSNRIVLQMKKLQCSLNEFVGAVSSLNPSSALEESIIDMLDLVSSTRDMEKIFHFVKRKGSGNLDTPEFLMYELSKIPFFKERIEFLRFRYKLLVNLFEIDQQLKELMSACDEVTDSHPLRKLLATLLAIGNYINGNTEMGQADGFSLDILHSLKDRLDKHGKSNLLEFVMKTYCHQYELNTESGCPSSFKLPEPSNMRHAAQVSFDDIQNALNNLRTELCHVREKVDSISGQDSNGAKTTLDKFFLTATQLLDSKTAMMSETKDSFIKTLEYFTSWDENMDTTPQQFFQIWAAFLHECKYYWKISHRKLAREQFNSEFIVKSKQPSSRTPQKGESGQKGASTSSHLTHVKSWVQSLQDFSEHQRSHVTPSEDSSKAHPDPLRHQHGPSKDRSQSPQPVKSSFNVRDTGQRRDRSRSPQHVRSMPTNVPNTGPIETQTLVPGGGAAPLNSAPVRTNYENLGDPNKNSYHRDRAHTDVYSNNQSPVKSNSFSFKSFKSPGQSRDKQNIPESSDTPSGTPKPSKNPLQKIRSTVQKFTQGHHRRRHTDTYQPMTPMSGPANTGTGDDQHGFEERPTEMAKNEQINSVSKDGKPKIVVETIKPGSQPQMANSYNYGYKGPQHCTVVNEHSESDKEAYNDYASNDRYAYPNRSRYPTTTKDQDNEITPQRSNIAMCDTLGKSLPDVSSTKPKSDILVQPSAAELKCIRSNPVPVYTARRIPNYENHGKLDPSYVVKQQIAQPAELHHGKPQTMSPQKDQTGNMDFYRQELQRRSDQYLKSPPGGEKDGTLRTERPLQNQGHYGNRYVDEQGPFPKYGSLNLQSQTSKLISTNGSWPRDNNTSRSPNDSRENVKKDNNGKSVNSLIEKFEKSKESEPNKTYSSGKMHGKPLTMTSTPVSPRKTISAYADGDDDSDSPPPLPPRPSDLYESQDGDIHNKENIPEPNKYVPVQDSYNIRGNKYNVNYTAQSHNDQNGNYYQPSENYDKRNYATENYDSIRPTGNQRQAGYGSTRPPGKMLNHQNYYSTEHAGAHDERYREQLRKASKSTPDRYHSSNANQPINYASHGLPTTAVVKPSVFKQNNMNVMQI